MFQEAHSGLSFTHELPKDSRIQFLDLKVDWSKVTVYYRVDDLGGALCTPVHPEMKDCVSLALGFTQVARNIRHAHGSPVVELALEEFRYSAQIFTARLAAAAVPSFASELALLKGMVPVWRELGCFLLRCSPHTLPALALVLLEWLSPKRGHPALTRVLARADTLRNRLDALLGASNALFVYPSHPEPAPFHYQPLLKPFNYAFTAIFNVLGYPTCQCPVGISPLGVQVVAAFYKDHLCLDGAREVEKAFCGLLQPPTE
ncbi:hypothetical protein HPB49_003050 [Dermacentor silvarum]|uniref:Uncharacterized protein n=1 Tax=Dermacentor silvarum TaxID=543639 RepID=A0ACB8DTK4_DERSI|nr:hypothetical protein HPB49_003050 [Dermacentor silvarum]